MPIYEYHCAECGQKFEALERLNDRPLDTCRICGGRARRIISSPAIQFVGTGWYVTDYARKGTAEGAAKKDGAPSGSSGKKGNGKKGKKDAAAATGKGKAETAAASP